MRPPDDNSASIELEPIEHANQAIQDYLDRTRDRFGLGFDPTMGRVIAADEAIWKGEALASRVAYSSGLLSMAEKEMIAACVSAMNACEY